MNWYRQSVVERMRAILEGHYEPDPSSSLLISLQGTGSENAEDQMYWDMYLMVFPPKPEVFFGATNVEEGFVVALREAISELSLPSYVRVEEFDDNSWRLGRLHGMRRKEEMPLTDRFMNVFQKTVGHTVNMGIEGFINLHFVVTTSVLIIAASAQNDTLMPIAAVALSLTILKDNDWRSLQKRRLARLVHRKEQWRESELDYRRRLRDECSDPDKWNRTKALVTVRIFCLLLGKAIDRYNEWRATHRASIRLARMSSGNGVPSP